MQDHRSYFLIQAKTRGKQHGKVLPQNLRAVERHLDQHRRTVCTIGLAEGWRINAKVVCAWHNVGICGDTADDLAQNNALNTNKENGTEANKQQLN